MSSASSPRRVNLTLQILAIVQMQDSTAENDISTLANGVGCQMEMLLDTQRSVVAGHCSTLTSDTMPNLDWRENVNNNLNACVHTHMSTSYIMYT